MIYQTVQHYERLTQRREMPIDLHSKTRVLECHDIAQRYLVSAQMAIRCLASNFDLRFGSFRLQL